MPDFLTSDPKSRELVRIWLDKNENQVFLISRSGWDDPAAWGLLLVDLAKQIARQYADTSSSFSEGAALERIRQGLDMEWRHPTGG